MKVGSCSRGEHEGGRLIVMCGNNHWIIMPNLAKSIQIDLWPGRGTKVLFMATSDPPPPVIQQTKMEEPQTAVSALLGLVSVALITAQYATLLLDDWGGDHWLP